MTAPDYDQIALDIARKHTADDDSRARAALQVDIIEALKPKNPGGAESLVRFVGDDNIVLQMIHQSIDGEVKLIEKGKATRLSIATDVENFSPVDAMMPQLAKKVGVLLWLDRQTVEAWRKA